MKSVFSGDMRVGENTSRPANVEIGRHRRTIYALQQAAIPALAKDFLCQCDYSPM